MKAFSHTSHEWETFVTVAINERQAIRKQERRGSMNASRRISIVLVLSLAAGVLSAQQPAAPPQSSPAPGRPGMMGEKKMDEAMMARHKEMMAKMEAMDARLDDLVKKMDAAKGGKKVEATAAVVRELVTQRKQMREHMMTMQPQMMRHMMEHMRMGMMKGMMECPMMKEMGPGKAPEKQQDYPEHHPQ